MLPLVSEIWQPPREPRAFLMAGTIAVPQFIVAIAAPCVGHYAEHWGRKAILLIGFGLAPIRDAAFAISQSPFSLMTAQMLDGIVGAIVTVMTVLVITDLTTGTGRFNLARGAVGTCTGIAAAMSTTATGVIAGSLAREAAFLTTAGVTALAALFLWLFCRRASRANISIEISRPCS